MKVNGTTEHIVLPMPSAQRWSRLARAGCCRWYARRGGSSSAASAPPPPLLSDERILVGPGYNRWVQLGPTTLAGLGIGAYFTVPGVLGPGLCKAQGVVAQAATDFSMSTLVPTLTLMPLVAASLAAGLARTSDEIGVRRLGLAASIVYPMGVYVLPAAAVAANSLSAFAPCYALIGGIGFFAGYPQIPPFLMRWFPDRKGLALSLYGATFGGLARPFPVHCRAGAPGPNISFARGRSTGADPIPSFGGPWASVSNTLFGEPGPPPLLPGGHIGALLRSTHLRGHRSGRISFLLS